MFYCGRLIYAAPLKIILTVTNDLSYDQRMWRICTALAEDGHAVKLVGRQLKKSITLNHQPYEQERLRCWFVKGKLFYAEYNIRLFFFLLFQKADAICSIDLDTILAGFFACRLKSIKQVYDAHEYFTEVPEVLERPVVRKAWEQIAAYTIPKIKNAYTVNESLAAIFEERYKTKFTAIYNTPPYREIAAPDNFKRRIILYQGALNEARGLEELISAMVHIDAILWLIGEGDLSYKLREQVKRLKIDNKVIFKGMVAPAELPTYTLQATIGINVSRNMGLSYYHSLNNKCFDYMHAALPSVTNDFPEYRRINDRFEIMLLTQCREDLLRNDILALLNNEELYLKLKQNCLLASKYYSWQAEKEKLKKIYAHLR
jgi:glycosyltransferase involved in cell wall biosynthesis